MIKIFELGKIDNENIFSRVTPKFDIEKTVSDIIGNVKANGDLNQEFIAAAIQDIAKNLIMLLYAM